MTLIDLSLGEITCGPDEKVKGFISEIAKCDWQGYLKAPGIPRLREMIAKRFQEIYEIQLTPENVLVTTGASMGLTAIYHILPEKRLLIPEIGFPLYRKTTALLGVETQLYHFRPTTNWDRTVQDIEEGFRRGFRALLWNNPHNPLGIVAPAEITQRVSYLCKQYKAICISDEVYRDFIYEGNLKSPANYIPFQTLFLYSFSKSYSMAGARVGFVISHPTIIRQLTSVHWSMGMSTPWLSQEAALFALEHTSHYPVSLAKKMGDRLRWASQQLRINGITSYEPNGGIFLCISVEPLEISADQFVIHAKEKANILLMSGREFGDEKLVRINAGIDEVIFKEGIQRIIDLYKSLKERVGRL
ncbi:pyridoxal phosphate-dependent aminotransferase [Brevibacillus sp. GCM10020057]|uniref:pyridoxal phosphate-dependent aminotransferase n=1 Tax=Brevibacillus sp. GCM10020057 TaxID=3317327 RepID=UPI00363F4BF1